MLSLQTTEPPVRMSTVEIAELIGKRHDNVLRTCRKVVAGLTASDLRPLDFEDTYTDQKGEQRACLRLPFRETMICLTRISTPHAEKVVDRWAELEKEKAASVTSLPAVEPPLELFPPNALERLTGTTIDTGRLRLSLQSMVSKSACRIRAGCWPTIAREPARSRSTTAAGYTSRSCRNYSR